MPEPMTPQEMGRYLASLRGRKKTICVICGKPIEGTTRRLYCSNACRVKAHYQRHHDAVLARQRESRKAKRQKAQAEGEGGSNAH